MDTCTFCGMKTVFPISISFVFRNQRRRRSRESREIHGYHQIKPADSFNSTLQSLRNQPWDLLEFPIRRLRWPRWCGRRAKSMFLHLRIVTPFICSLLGNSPSAFVYQKSFAHTDTQITHCHIETQYLTKSGFRISLLPWLATLLHPISYIQMVRKANFDQSGRAQGFYAVIDVSTIQYQYEMRCVNERNWTRSSAAEKANCVN